MNRFALTDLQCLYNRVLVCEDVIHYNGTLLLDLSSHKQLEALKDAILSFKIYCEREFVKSKKTPEDLANEALDSPLPFPRTEEAFITAVALSEELRKKWQDENEAFLDPTRVCF